MFDANASNIEIGKKFFAEVHAVDAVLCKMGIVRGDIILCEHVEKYGKFWEENTLTKIWTQQDKDSGHYEYNAYSVTGYSLLVYSGCPDGKGFINSKWKQKALDFLGGEWDAN